MINYKRGQERSLLMWILGIATVVVVILFVYNFFNQGDKVLGNAPDDATVIGEACKLAAELGNTNAFCFQFRELHFGSKVVYATCDSAHKDYQVEIENWAQNGEELCKDLSTNIESRAKEFCKTQSDDTIVNEKVCYSSSEDGWGVSKSNPGETPAL